MDKNIKIAEYKPEYASAFKALNEAWITRYFVLEDIDRRALEDPEGHILNKGGAILFAEIAGQIAGTCALLKEHDGVYELAKMAVDEKYQGLGIGYAIGRAAIEKARALGANTLMLLSNRRLTPAMQLYKKLGFSEVPLPEGSTEYIRADIKMEIKF